MQRSSNNYMTSPYMARRSQPQHEQHLHYPIHSYTNQQQYRPPPQYQLPSGGASEMLTVSRPYNRQHAASDDNLLRRTDDQSEGGNAGTLV